jgi:hypothetical protein
MDSQNHPVKTNVDAECDTSEIVEGVVACHTQKDCQQAVYLGPVKLCIPQSDALWNPQALPKQPIEEQP